MFAKRIFAAVLIIILVLTILPGAGSVYGDDNPRNAADHILVKFRAAVPESTRAGLHTANGGKVIGSVRGLNIDVVGIAANRIEEKLQLYRAFPGVEYAEPDYIATVVQSPDDSYYTSQWAISKIDAPDAWEITQGSPSIKIAICDTGIDQNHEDLAAKIVVNQNFTTSTTVDDLYGHGTHCAGIAAAVTDNGIGVAGLGYNSSLMNVKVLDDTGSGLYSWIASGITWAADNGAKVISLSLGGSEASQTVEDAVNYAWSKGALVVAAAGNSGGTSPLYPAYYANCIAVAATDQNDAKASFSSYGSWVDIAAPGVSIYSCLPNHPCSLGGPNYGYLNGTSMATPYVAGLAALLWATPYGTDNSVVRARIESTADEIEGTGNYWQNGRINAYWAVAPAGSPAQQTVEILKPVAAGADDGFSGVWGCYPGTSWFEVGNPGRAYNAWLRFGGITIPKGATILEAHLEINQTKWGSGTKLKIRAEKVASPAAPTSTANHNKKIRTTAGADWTSGFSDYAYHSTPDITAVIQELVNSYDYANGAMQILIDNNGGTGEAVGKPFESGAPPQLYIKYQTAGGTPPPPPVNHAPVLDPIGNKTAATGQVLTFSVTASDPDGNTLSYTATNLPAGASFNASTHVFSWTPTATGTYTNIRFEVSDGALTDFENVTILVAAAASGNTTGTVASTPVSSGGGNEYNFFLNVTSSTVSGITPGQRVWCAATTTDFPNLLTVGTILSGNLDHSPGWWVFKKAAG